MDKKTFRETLRKMDTQTLDEQVNTHSPSHSEYTMIIEERRRREAIRQEAGLAQLNTRMEQTEQGIRELRKTHWTVVPIFWMVLLGTAVAIATLILTLL